MDPELQLIDRARNGERAAFEALVEIYKERALALSYGFTGNIEDAKDILQEAFVKAYVNISRFRGGSGFYTWFYRILVNLCKDHLRRRKTRFRVFAEPLETEDGSDTQAADPPDGAPDPSQVIVNKEIKQKIEEAVNRLPGRQKTVFILRHIQGMKLGEIAEVVGCGESTAKVHLFRAENALKDMLKTYIYPDDEGRQ